MIQKKTTGTPNVDRVTDDIYYNLNKLTNLAIQGITGIKGVTGFRGVTGLQGSTGVQGTTGLQGETGLQGIQGSTGAYGGPQGVTGLQGYTGAQGVTGLNGVTGLQGSTGVQGSTGLQGAQGNTGPTGTTGLQGANGNQGATGLQGLTGSNGLQGSTGLRGATGLQGIAGSTGVQGIQGVTGLRGATGLNGTNGSQGIQGSTGIQGITGLRGSTGIQGITGLRGSTGIQGITGLIGGTGVQGITGLRGTTGVQGVTGIQGPGGTGTTNYITKFTNGAAGTIGNSIIQDSGTKITIGGNVALGIRRICNDDTSVGGLSFGLGTTNGALLSNFSSTSGDVRANLTIQDETPYNTGVGGGIDFRGFYSDYNLSTFSGIKGIKANATNGNNAGQLHFQTRTSGGALTTRLIINENGNVAIGKSSVEAWNSGYRSLQIGGNCSILGANDEYSGRATLYLNNCYLDASATWKPIVSGYASIFRNSGSYFSWQINSGLTADTSFTPTTIMELSNTGILNLPSLTASRAVITDGSKNIVSSAVTSAELALLSGKNSVIDGSGTTGRIPYFTSAQRLTNSPIYTNGTNVSIGKSSVEAWSTGNFALQIGGASAILTKASEMQNGTYYMNNAYNDNSGFKPFVNGAAAIYSTSSANGSHIWFSNTGLTADTAFTPTIVMSLSGGFLNLPSLTASRAIVTDGSKNIVSSATTATELALLSGKNSVIDGSGTANYIPYFSATNRLTNSVLSHITNGVKIGIQSTGATATPSKITFDGSFADTTVSSKAQIDLHGGYYGFGVSQATLNYWSYNKHDYYSNNVKCMSINSKGINLGTENDPSTDQGNQWITWGVRADNNPYYCIRTNYETYGSYTYSRLQLNWHTGIEIGAASQFGGTRFFNNSVFTGTQIMSIGDGDNHVRVANNLYATNLQASDGCYAYNTTTANTGTYIGVVKYPGSLPGLSASYPALKTDFTNLHFVANNKYVGYWGSDGTTSYIGINGQTGIVTTPDFIELGHSHINTSTVTNKSSKCKLFMYKDDANSDYYGFGIGNVGDIQHHSNAYHDFYISNEKVVSISGTGLIVTPTSYSIGDASIGASYGDYGFWFKKSSYFLDYGQKLDIADDYHFTILFNGMNRFRIQSDGTYTFGSATVSDVLTAGTRLVTNEIETADSGGFLTIGGAGATNAMVFINARLGHTHYNIDGGSGTIPIYTSYVRLTYSGSSSTYTLGTPPETTVVTRVIVANKSTTAHTVNGRSIGVGSFSEFVYDPYGTAGWLIEF